MFDILEVMLEKSGLDSMFELKEKDDHTAENKPWVSYRVKANMYKIRAFELWGTSDDYFLRIYHAPNIIKTLKDSLGSFSETITSKQHMVDFKTEDYDGLASKLQALFMLEEIQAECRENSRFSRTSRFEGLELPDVDFSLDDVLGQTFTWREIIAIWENDSEENQLKKVLSKKGIYIQRSEDGKSRYIGSAYGSEGMIGRWMNHLNSNGAQHLNLFVLESGYNEILFSVIEFTDGSDSEIIQKESKWKRTLGTINYGPYNGIQLNNN